MMAFGIVKNLLWEEKCYVACGAVTVILLKYKKILSFREEVEKSEKQATTKPQQAKNNNWNNTCIFWAVTLKFWLM